MQNKITKAYKKFKKINREFKCQLDMLRYISFEKKYQFGSKNCDWIYVSIA